MPVEHDVVYGTGDGRDLRCDIYRPETSNGAGQLLLHAGSWRRGDKTSMAGQAAMLTVAGYTCVASEYRLVTKSSWPAQRHDVKAALRWLRANSDTLQVEAERLGVLGNSAGGHADIAECVAACGAFYPATLLYLGEPCPDGIPAAGLFTATPTADEVRAASPVTYAHTEFLPTFLLHGTADEMVPYTASVCMYEALAAQGATAELHLQSQARACVRYPRARDYPSGHGRSGGLSRPLFGDVMTVGGCVISSTPRHICQSSRHCIPSRSVCETRI